MPVLTRKQIADRFISHPADEVQRDKITEVTNMFIRGAERLNDLLPEGRDKALVLTHLEEAKMRAVRAITIPGGVQ